VIAGALLAEDVRPRELRFDDALLVVLRGVNLNPGADPEDMVGIRIWLEPTCILTVRHRHLMAISDLREAIATGRGQLRAPPGHAERPDDRAHGTRDRRSGR
jgi:zinc transporter